MDTINLYVVLKRCLEVRQDVVVSEDPDPVFTKESPDRDHVLCPWAETPIWPPLVIVQPKVSLASFVRGISLIIPRSRSSSRQGYRELADNIVHNKMKCFMLCLSCDELI